MLHLGPYEYNPDFRFNPRLSMQVLIRTDHPIGSPRFGVVGHTDQYRYFSLNHSIKHKLSMVQNLHHQAKTVVTNEDRKLVCKNVATLDALEKI